MEESIKFSGGSITLLSKSRLSLNEVLTLLNVVMGLMVEYIKTVKHLTGGGKEKTKKEKKAAANAANAAADAAANAAADAAADAKVKDLLEKVLAETSPEGADSNENIRETLNETIENYSEAINNDETPYRSSGQSWATFFLKSFKGNTLLLLFIAFSFIQPSEGFPFLLPAILTGLQGAMYTGVILSEFAFFDYLIKEQQVALEAKQLSQAIDNNLFNISDCAQTILTDVPPSFVSLSGQPLINATQFLGTEVYAPPSLSDVNVSELINYKNFIETFSVQINTAPSIKEQFSNATIGFNALAQSNLIFLNNVSTPQMCLVLNESTNTSTVAFIMKDHSDVGNIGLFLPETLTVNSSGTVDFNASTNATEKLWPQKVGQGAFQIIFNSSNTKTTVSTKILTELFVPIVYLTAPTDSTVGHRRTMITETPVATETSVRLQAQGPPAQLVLSGITDVGQSLITVEAPFSKKGTRTSGTKSESSSSFNPNLKIYTLLLSSLAAGVAAGAAAVSKRHQEISQENITRFVANNLDVVADVEQQISNNPALNQALSNLSTSKQDAFVTKTVVIASMFDQPVSSILNNVESFFDKFNAGNSASSSSSSRSRSSSTASASSSSSSTASASSSSSSSSRSRSNASTRSNSSASERKLNEAALASFFYNIYNEVKQHAPNFLKNLKLAVASDKLLLYLYKIFLAEKRCATTLTLFVKQLEYLYHLMPINVEASDVFFDFLLDNCLYFKDKPFMRAQSSSETDTTNQLQLIAAFEERQQTPTKIKFNSPKTKKLPNAINFEKLFFLPKQLQELLLLEFKTDKNDPIEATNARVTQTRAAFGEIVAPGSPPQQVTESRIESDPLQSQRIVNQEAAEKARLSNEKALEQLSAEWNKNEQSQANKKGRIVTDRPASINQETLPVAEAEAPAITKNQPAETLQTGPRASLQPEDQIKVAANQIEVAANRTEVAANQTKTSPYRNPQLVPPAGEKSKSLDLVFKPQNIRNQNIVHQETAPLLQKQEVSVKAAELINFENPTEAAASSPRKIVPKKSSVLPVPSRIAAYDKAYIREDLQKRKENTNVTENHETFIYVSQYITNGGFNTLREILDKLYPTKQSQNIQKDTYVDFHENQNEKAIIYRKIVLAANRCDQPIKFILQALESELKRNQEVMNNKIIFQIFLTNILKKCLQRKNGTKVSSKLMEIRQNVEKRYKAKDYSQINTNELKGIDDSMYQAHLTGKYIDYQFISDYINDMAPTIRKILDQLYKENKKQKASIYDQIYLASLRCNQPIRYILEEISIQIDVFLKSNNKYFYDSISEPEFHIILSNALNNCFRINNEKPKITQEVTPKVTSKKTSGPATTKKTGFHYSNPFAATKVQSKSTKRVHFKTISPLQVEEPSVPHSENLAQAQATAKAVKSTEIEDWQRILTKKINYYLDQKPEDSHEINFWSNVVSSLSTQQDIDDFKNVVVEKKGVNNVLNVLNKYPVYIMFGDKTVKSPCWQKKDNAGDGHCFYHAVLRFIYIQAIQNPQDVFWQAAKNDYVPKDYSLFNQSPKDVAALRLANFNHLLEMVKNTDDEKNKTEYQSYLLAIRKALENEQVDSYGHAGMGVWREKEFESIAQLLQICMVFWQYVEKGQQGKYIAQAFIPNVPEEHASDKNLNQSCPYGIMYVVNSNNDHFQNIFPVVPKLITGGRRRICTKRAGLKRAKTTRRTRRSLGQRRSLNKRRSSGGQRKKSRILKKRRGALKVTRRRCA